MGVAIDFFIHHPIAIGPKGASIDKEIVKAIDGSRIFFFSESHETIVDVRNIKSVQWFSH